MTQTQLEQRILTRFEQATADGTCEYFHDGDDQYATRWVLDAFWLKVYRIRGKAWAIDPDCGHGADVTDIVESIGTPGAVSIARRVRGKPTSVPPSLESES